tara:strand:- start:1359 stop:1829 length:471 start_codon:yes stop_codon:yes gene_type:complete
MIIILNFPFNLNESLQVGDTILFTSVTSNSSVTTGSTQPEEEQNIFHNDNSALHALGIVKSIGFGQSSIAQSPSSILTELFPDNPLLEDPVQHIEVNVSNNSVLELFSNTSMIFFAKNSKVNVSTIKGYYANAQFINNSTDKAELFCVNANVSKSS